MNDIYGIPVRTIAGADSNLEPFRNQVLLIVNVASKCGFTPQYEGLEALYRKYHDRGFAVLGFPCDQFGHQEPGSESEIQNFCTLTYEVTFPMFAKIAVNGSAAHPLYKYLKKAQPGVLGTEGIKWNFTKFLINRQGQVIERFAPTDTPAKIDANIAALLN